MDIELNNHVNLKSSNVERARESKTLHRMHKVETNTVASSIRCLNDNERMKQPFRLLQYFISDFDAYSTATATDQVIDFRQLLLSSFAVDREHKISGPMPNIILFLQIDAISLWPLELTHSAQVHESKQNEKKTKQIIKPLKSILSLIRRFNKKNERVKTDMNK